LSKKITLLTEDLYPGNKEESQQNDHRHALASESSLKKDWLLPEEDEVWANL
jgi:hypothetical protein